MISEFLSEEMAEFSIEEFKSTINETCGECKDHQLNESLNEILFFELDDGLNNLGVNIRDPNRKIGSGN